MISANEYFDGNVKSLGYESEEGKSTIGVINPGKYKFGTSMSEIMFIIEGQLDVLLPGAVQWITVNAGEEFKVPAHQSFEVSATKQTSYLCKYS
jgi:uncharacterized protein YaiE (UPF0345 family)